LPSDEIDLAGLQIRNAVRAIDRHEFEFYVHRLREQRGSVDVIALRFHVGANGTERRIVFRHGHFQHTGFGDVVERIGVSGRRIEGEDGGEQQRNKPGATRGAKGRSFHVL
jgi:hypothetical protein